VPEAHPWQTPVHVDDAQQYPSLQSPVVQIALEPHAVPAASGTKEQKAPSIACGFARLLIAVAHDTPFNVPQVARMRPSPPPVAFTDCEALVEMLCAWRRIAPPAPLPPLPLKEVPVPPAAPFELILPVDATVRVPAAMNTMPPPAPPDAPFVSTPHGSLIIAE
jgi:hypothetical protein